MVKGRAWDGRVTTCAIACLLTFVITGCVPTISSVYDIDGAGDKRYTAGCCMSTEANLSIPLTSTTNIVFWGPANRKPSNQLILSIIVTISGNEAVSLTQSIVEVTSTGAKEPLAIPITAIRRADASFARHLSFTTNRGVGVCSGYRYSWQSQ